MPSHSKLALAALALALSCAPVMAQADSPDDPPRRPIPAVRAVWCTARDLVAMAETEAGIADVTVEVGDIARASARAAGCAGAEVWKAGNSCSAGC